MRFGCITGLASSLPQQIIHNEYFSSYLDTSDEWIQKRTGIVNRHWVSEDESALSLATEVLERLIRENGLPEAVIVATCSANKTIPSLAHRLCHLLGLNGLHFDINSACSGFVVALVQADALIQSGVVNSVAVIGVDVMSQLINKSDRATAILFGDGAAGIMLSCGVQPQVRGINYGSDVAACEILGDQGDMLKGVLPRIVMQGREVFKLAVQAMTESIESCVKEAGQQPSEVDWFFCHQANRRILEAVAKRLGVDVSRFYLTLPEHGNTSSASVPLALAHAQAKGRLEPGQVIVMSAIGAGMSWASIILDWR